VKASRTIASVNKDLPIKSTKEHLSIIYSQLIYSKPVFTEEENYMFETLPTKQEVLYTINESNLNTTPGTDGINSLVYKLCWDTHYWRSLLISFRGKIHLHPTGPP
jgi:hypothetical protein